MQGLVIVVYMNHGPPCPGDIGKPLLLKTEVGWTEAYYISFINTGNKMSPCCLLASPEGRG